MTVTGQAAGALGAPIKIVEIKHCTIPMPDGCRLAARIWMPADATSAPVPAIFEYIPYRKNDVTAFVDSLTHPYFAGHGYVAIRVDIRGSGESEGVLDDNYGQQEHEDALNILKWIASQPWCSGEVGMIGLSWGGMTALQIASMHPPELKAVIAICASDDQQRDDVYFMNGCLLNENIGWGSLFQAQISRPPDPALVGERWRDMWLERLNGIVLPMETWLRHQRRDAYWKRMVVSERYEAIRCPVYAVGGWADGYHNAILRLMAKLKGPRKGLIGPWQHIYPHYAGPGPGPAIGFLKEALRWWDHWLKGINTGIADEPLVTAWMQESIKPTTYLPMRPGRWIREATWPSSNIEPQRFVLNTDGIQTTPAPEGDLSIHSPQCIGADAGLWLPEHEGAELPGDQRYDDSLSLVLDSEPLHDSLEIFGTPRAILAISLDKPLGLVAVRLCDVHPDGTSERVTFGIQNLSRRESEETPKPLDPGERYDVQVDLKDIAHVFLAGHRIRIAISTAYWPMVWPSPEPVTLTLRTGRSWLELPVRPRGTEEESYNFGPPEPVRPIGREILRPSDHSALVHRNLMAGVTSMTVMKDDGAYRLEENGLEFDHAGSEQYFIENENPLSARVRTRWKIAYARGDWRIRIENDVLVTSTRNDFNITSSVDAYEGEIRIFSRNWNVKIPRDMV